VKRAVVLVSLFSVAMASPAFAGDSAADATAIDAYQRGSQLLQANKPAEALPLLETSMRDLPSPNTELLIGHALRDLGRKVEAEEHYAAVRRDAAARIRAGEDRYGPTLADANHWFTVLRASLSEVSIVIERAPPGITILIDDVEAKTEFDANLAMARTKAWHLPGHASIAIRAPSGSVEHTSADLVAGGASEVRLVFVRETSGSDVRESVVVETPRSARPPAASLVSAGVAAIALGTFIGFGVDANAAANELKTCSQSATGCPAARFQPVADRGSRSAEVANVSVAIAGAGLATAAVIWIVAAKRRDPRTGSTTPATALGLRF
jgi:hypothetical protein